MKVIDILNKIANGEIELGTKINWHYKFSVTELVFTERQGALGLYFQREDRLIGLFEEFNYQILNDEVEIIEEVKKIEKLNIEIQNKETGNCYIINEKGTKCYLTKHSRIIANKVNEIIDYLNNKVEEK